MIYKGVYCSMELKIYSYKNKNFDGIYSISSDGSVYSRKRKRPIRLKTFTDGRRGYLKVRLYDINGDRIDVYIHLLVMEFFGETKPGPLYECHHKDHDKNNNDISNLEWVTPRQNVRAAIDSKIGCRAKCLDLKIVRSICRRIAKGYRNCEIIRSLGVSKHAVEKIKAKKNYKYISDTYF